MDFHSTNKWINVTRFRLLCYPRIQATAYHDVLSPISPLCANSADTTTYVSAKTSVNCFFGQVQCFGLCVYCIWSLQSFQGDISGKHSRKFPCVFGRHLYIQEYPSYKRGGSYTSSLRPGGILYVLYYKFKPKNLVINVRPNLAYWVSHKAPFWECPPPKGFTSGVKLALLNFPLW
jgi:hypothetical protein